MAEKTLAAKIGLKPRMKALLLNAPQGAQEPLGPLPEGTTVSTVAGGEQVDHVLAFAASAAELAAQAPAAIGAYQEGGHLWFAYPKKTSKLKTDIDRDHGWEPLTQAGFLPVTQISIDNTWSALRWRKRDEIKVLTRKF
ncbi:MAG: hypothetical protein IPK19_13595 [Chloroflexi bacterium]|nr:hypothetical protein [Chloroflexota bacterium]